MASQHSRTTGALASAAHSPPRHRVFAEHVPFSTLASAAVLEPLAARKIGLIVALQPHHRGAAARASWAYLHAACAEAQVRLVPWPMLDDARGRWANVGNAAAFAEFVGSLISELRRTGCAPAELAIDLEPPIQRMQASLRGRPLLRPLAPPHARTRWAQAHACLRRMVADVHAHNIATFATVAPVLAYDPYAGGWQHVLGTPIDGLAIEHVSVMLYSSLVSGYSGGTLGRSDVRALLYWAACRAAQRFGRRAGACVGVVGPGAFGDEPTLADPSTLADDVALMKAAGITALEVFDVGGMLARPPLCDWLDALSVRACMRAPAWTVRAACVHTTALGVAHGGRWLGLSLS